MRSRVSFGALALGAALLCGCSGGKGPTLESDPTREHYDRIMESQRERRAARAEIASPTSAPASTDELLARGDRERREGERSEALKLYLQAVSREPSAATPRARIGYLHLQEDPQRAAGIFADVVQRDPASLDGWLGLALARLALGDAPSAVEPLERARALQPEAVPLLSVEALVRDQLGEHADAQRLWARALEQRPRDPALLNNLGLSYLTAGDFTGAAGAFRRALEVDPKSPVSHNNLGLALGRQGDYAGALAAFRRAGPEGVALTNLGWVHHLNGDHEGAIARYLQALDAPGVDKVAVLRNLEVAEAARLAGAASPAP